MYKLYKVKKGNLILFNTSDTYNSCIDYLINAVRRNKKYFKLAYNNKQFVIQHYANDQNAEICAILKVHTEMLSVLKVSTVGDISATEYTL